MKQMGYSLVAVSITAVFFWEFAVAGSPCPKNRRNINPCSCHEIQLSAKVKRSSLFTLVECKSFQNKEEVWRATQSFQYLIIDRLVLSTPSRNSLSRDNYYYDRNKEILNQMWKLPKMQLRELVFQDQSFRYKACIWQTESSPMTFSEDTVIRMAVINCTFFNQLISNSCMEELSKWTGLRNLAISGNNISQGILSQFPASLGQLETLDLSFNELPFVERETFVNLKRLTYLNLSGNMLITLKPDVFTLPVGNTLVELDLSWNPLLALPDDFFSAMVALQKLYLGHTFIQIIDSVAVANAPSLNYIDLTESFINCNCSMSWTASFSRKPVDSSMTNETTTNSERSLLKSRIVKVEGFCKNPRSLEFQKISSSANYKTCS